MWERFRFDKKLGIERKYINIAIVVVVTGLLLFIGYELIKNSGMFFIALASVIGKFLRVVRPLFIGFIIAYLLYPGVMFFERSLKKLTKKRGLWQGEKYQDKNWIYRIISVILVFLVLVLAVIAIFNFIIPPLMDSGRALINNIPQYEEVVNNGIGNLNKLFDSLSIDASKVSSFMDKITAVFTTAGEDIVNVITTSIQGIGAFVVDFILSFIFAFYFLKDKEMLFRVVKKYVGLFIPSRIKPNVKRFIVDMDEVVGKFIKGVLCDAIIVAIVSSILLLIVRHPFAILVGILAGICNIVPYVGPLVGEIIAFILGLFTSISTGIWGFIVLLLYQQVDGNIIQPKIVGGKVGLAPVFTLAALTIGGGYAGVLGMIAAVPVAGMLSLYIKRFYKKKHKEKTEIKNIGE